MSQKVNALVNYIKCNDLFDLDVMDLLEMNGLQVLEHFGIRQMLSEWEEALFMQDMFRLAASFQTAEIARNTPVEFYLA